MLCIVAGFALLKAVGVAIVELFTPVRTLGSGSEIIEAVAGALAYMFGLLDGMDSISRCDCLKAGAQPQYSNAISLALSHNTSGMFPSWPAI